MSSTIKAFVVCMSTAILVAWLGTTDVSAAIETTVLFLWIASLVFLVLD